MSVRYDFYQSDSFVVMEVMLKSAKERNYQVEIKPKKVTMKADNCFLDISLYGTIDAERSSHKATSTKVEIKLAKTTSERWPTLEETTDEKKTALPAFGTHNWDKLATEDDKEEAKGEEGLNNLLQKIYSESSDEVRRAMNKSFSESGGTVLSTNWKEVGERQVKASPPDGLELRKWD